MTNDSIREAQAYHEAGHVVVCHFVNGELIDATIDPPKPAVSWRVTARGRSGDFQKSRVALAGPLAQQIHEGDSKLLAE